MIGVNGMSGAFLVLLRGRIDAGRAGLAVAVGHRGPHLRRLAGLPVDTIAAVLAVLPVLAVDPVPAVLAVHAVAAVEPVRALALRAGGQARRREPVLAVPAVAPVAAVEPVLAGGRLDLLLSG